MIGCLRLRELDRGTGLCRCMCILGCSGFRFRSEASGLGRGVSVVVKSIAL